jgi:hypothetical protein
MLHRGFFKGGVAACAAVVVAAGTGGCSSTMDGAATKSTSPSSSAAAGVDASKLDAGNYKTTPRAALGEAGKPEVGALLEAQRLANYVTGPWEVDPSLTAPLAFGIGPGSLALPGGAKALTTFFSPDQNQAMAIDGYLYGFATARQVAKQKQLMNVVLRFTDPAAASAAANSIAQAQIAHPIPLPPPIPTTSITIPAHPEAVATTHMFEDKNIGQTWTVVDSFTPRGPFVLMQRAQLIGAADGATSMVAKTLDLQGPAIDNYKLVDPAQFAAVPRDPSGLLARAIPVPKGSGTPNSNITLDAHGLLNFDGDPVASAKTYGDAGVDLGVGAGDFVYRAKDAAAATGLVNAMVTKMQADGPVSETVPNLPGSRCQKAADGKSVTCVAATDRYAYQINAHTLKDAQQQAAAQHLLLTAP